MSARFFSVINRVNLDDYTAVVKLHTKRNIDTFPWWINEFDVSGNKWRKYLLSFCATTDNWCQSLEKLQCTENGIVTNMKMIARDGCHYARKYAEWKEISRKIGLNLPEKGGLYVSGTMFAIKPEILKKWQHIVKIDDFEETRRSAPFSLAHYFECTIGKVATEYGMRIVSYDGKEVPPFHLIMWRLHRILFYRKRTADKEIIKVLGIQIFRRKLR